MKNLAAIFWKFTMNEKLFWEKVNIKGPDDCWEWLGETTNGYGRFRVGKRRLRAHRIAWELHNELKLSQGQMILHSCDNPPCCNPKHLSPGTHLKNMKDRNDRGRTAQGESHYKAKLTESQVKEIRTRYKEEKISQRALGKEYGVDHKVICNIVLGRGWKSASMKKWSKIIEGGYAGADR